MTDMNVLILLIPIWVFSSPLVSIPVDIKPEPPLPPVSDPVLPKEPIFKTPADLPVPRPPGTQGAEAVHHQELNKKILISLIVASTLLGGILLLLCCLWLYRLKKLKKPKLEINQNTEAQPAGVAKGLSFAPILDKFNSLRISGKRGSVAPIEYQLLVAATNNFQDDNMLGEGGRGIVYKACFSDKLQAAIKKFHDGGQNAGNEFENEIDMLSKIQHQNIVSLLGYCIHGEMRFLIFEMMQNGSLESLLHGRSRGSTLSWHARMKIALDVSRGLEYLHEHCDPPVIHRDLKSSNILLDSNLNAKLSDFGLAITEGDASRKDIQLSGTLGYVAPEYLLDGKLTDKSDVYAFGVVLLELLTGRRAVETIGEAHSQSLVTWAMPQLKDRLKLPNIVDPVIRHTMDSKHLYQVAAIAVLCVQPEPSYRPLITDVLHSLIPLVPMELGGSLRVPESAGVVPNSR